MKRKNTFSIICFLGGIIIMVLSLACNPADPVIMPEKEHIHASDETPVYRPTLYDTVQFVLRVESDIPIKDYFDYLDQQIAHYDSLVPYSLTEHLLVAANPWMLDTLIRTDYYDRMAEGTFIEDQPSYVVLHQGDYLFIPAKNWATRLIRQQESRRIDINIPEYKLCLIEGDEIVHECLVRVGQNRKRYLKTAGGEVNLRTKTGIGTIVKITKDPIYMNPVDGHRYTSTLRDDERRTNLPQIPFLHPEINGHRWGQLIHPTTNENTLGKAYSNGCIGTREADAWRIYYHAPVGTAITIRYDLEVLQTNGDTLRLRDIYN